MKTKLSKIPTLILVGMMILSLVSCSTPGGRLATPSEAVPPLPPTPEWVGYTRRPILSKFGNNFIVSDEFITKATQEHRFVEKVLEWKNVNSIR
tara:strand:+ start:4905 stop:5186 length:282 start_codon:yes stop_codon:yes gene_type:complete